MPMASWPAKIPIGSRSSPRPPLNGQRLPQPPAWRRTIASSPWPSGPSAGSLPPQRSTQHLPNWHPIQKRTTAAETFTSPVCGDGSVWRQFWPAIPQPVSPRRTYRLPHRCAAVQGPLHPLPAAHSSRTAPPSFDEWPPAKYLPYGARSFPYARRGSSAPVMPSVSCRLDSPPASQPTMGPTIYVLFTLSITVASAGVTCWVVQRTMARRRQEQDLVARQSL